MTSSRPAAVIVLAAGEGTRMKSSTPKVLHPLLGRSLLAHVLGADAAPGRRTHDRRRRPRAGGGDRRTSPRSHASARAVVQAEQNGTGHAVRIALDALPDVDGAVVVVCGDTPLLTPYTLHRVVAEHDGRAAAATVLTAHLPDPTGYGRVVRGDDDGNVRAIVEHRDADGATLAVDEINSGIYVFDAAALRSALDRISTENSQGEEYLTDVIGILVDDGARVQGVAVNDPREVMGVNDRVQLAEARAVLRDRINDAWMRSGVSIIDPTTTFIDVDVQLAADCVIHPWTLLEGASTVAAGAEVGPGSQIVDTVVGPGATVRFTTADRAVIGPERQRRPVHLPATRAPSWPRGPGRVPSSRPRTSRSARDRRSRTCPTSAMPRSVRGPTSGRRPSSSTTTGSRSTAPSSVTTCGSAATPCWSPR